MKKHFVEGRDKGSVRESERDRTGSPRSHIHHSHGRITDAEGRMFVNASICDEECQPTHSPIMGGLGLRPMRIADSFGNSPYTMVLASSF